MITLIKDFSFYHFTENILFAIRNHFLFFSRILIEQWTKKIIKHNSKNAYNTKTPFVSISLNKSFIIRILIAGKRYPHSFIYHYNHFVCYIFNRSGLSNNHFGQRKQILFGIGISNTTVISASIIAWRIYNFLFRVNSNIITF